jgi:formylglycine-generating enzyme required for sulfatase activity
MGSSPDEAGHRTDEEQVEVTLTKGFWMGKFEVTQSQWARISGPFIQEMDKGAGDDLPVYWVNYLEAENFCRRLSARAWAAGSLPRDWEFRLPTEAQWEYACRAGTTTATSFGDSMTATQANFDGRPNAGARVGGIIPGASVKVGSYPANAWGLHDMHGNVWEWCRDWYHSTLPGGSDPDLSNVKGAINRDGTYSRVRRGGAWIESYGDSRSARRLKYEPERRSDHIGFRIVAVENSVPSPPAAFPLNR